MADKLIKSSHNSLRGTDGNDDSEPSPAANVPRGSGVNIVELAQRIKQKRIERRMTIEQLAASTGLTRSWLSKVENFRVTPSLPALFKIASNLGITLAELVEGLEEAPDLCLVRSGEGQTIDRDPSPQNNTTYQSLAHGRTSRAMDPFLLTIPGKGGRKECLPHDGEEFLFVVEGEVAFDYDNSTELLQTGDSVYLNGSTPHRVYNPTDQPARVLCVFFAN